MVAKGLKMQKLAREGRHAWLYKAVAKLSK